MPKIPEGSRITSLTDLAGRMSSAWNILLGREFNPGTPIQPTFSETEQTEGPRLTDYQITSNLVTTPRGEISGLTPFQQLRNLARLYDVAALCISTRIQEVTGLDWNITTKEKNTSQQLAHAQSGAIQSVTEFFEYPNKLDSFSDWLARLLRDAFEIDAATLYVQRDKTGGLYSLEVIDGSTIKPLIDDRGRVLAYQQIVKGLPASQYRRWGVDSPDEMFPLVSPYKDAVDQELIYLPRNVHTDSPYGISPTEFVLMRINTALRKQSFDLAWFTDGNIPEMLLSPPSDKMSGDQVAQFEQWFNSVLAGVDETRRKARFLAWDAKPTMLKEFSYSTTLDEWMMKLTCAAYDVTPAELGFTGDVNRATSQGQENIQYRKGIKPLTKWLKQLFDRIIAKELGHPELEFVWSFGEQEDSLAKAKEFDVWLKYGVITPQEARALNFGAALGDLAPAPGQVGPLLLPVGKQPEHTNDTETNENNDAETNEQ